jgi:hypothetical protein
VYEQTKDDVTQFTLDLDIAGVLETAPDRILNILEKGIDLGTGDPKVIGANQTIFNDFFIKEFYLVLYQKKIGFTGNQKLWPKKKHAETILRKIEFCKPGSTQELDSVKNKYRPNGTAESMFRRFHYNTNQRKIEFGIPSKSQYCQIFSKACAI